MKNRLFPPCKVAKTKKDYIDSETLSNMSFGELLKHGFINNTKLRNNQIRQEFHRLLNMNKYSVIECLGLIADDYCVSEETVRGIIYRKELP